MDTIAFIYSSLECACVCARRRAHACSSKGPSEVMSEIFLVGSLGQNDIKLPPENHNSTQCVCTLSSGMWYYFVCLFNG